MPTHDARTPRITTAYLVKQETTDRITGYGIDALHEFQQKYGVRLGWHEPHECDVSAELIGQHLDNHIGDIPGWESPMEQIVRVKHKSYAADNSSRIDHEVFINLASLIAAALWQY